MKLYSLKLGHYGIINSVNVSMNIRQRLYELGITPGTAILAAFSNARRDPVAYYIKGSVIAIRREDAEMIDIKEDVEHEKNGAETSC